MCEGETRKVALDWSRLLGFDQVDASACQPGDIRDPRLSGLHAKEGIKTGPKIGQKAGSKLGVKAGVKPGIKFGR